MTVYRYQNNTLYRIANNSNSASSSIKILISKFYQKIISIRDYRLFLDACVKKITNDHIDPDKLDCSLGAFTKISFKYTDGGGLFFDGPVLSWTKFKLLQEVVECIDTSLPNSYLYIHKKMLTTFYDQFIPYLLSTNNITDNIKEQTINFHTHIYLEQLEKNLAVDHYAWRVLGDTICILSLGIGFILKYLFTEEATFCLGKRYERNTFETIARNADLFDSKKIFSDKEAILRATSNILSEDTPPSRKDNTIAGYYPNSNSPINGHYKNSPSNSANNRYEPPTVDPTAVYLIEDTPKNNTITGYYANSNTRMDGHYINSPSNATNNPYKPTAVYPTAVCLTQVTYENHPLLGFAPSSNGIPSDHTDRMTTAPQGVTIICDNNYRANSRNPYQTGSATIDTQKAYFDKLGYIEDGFFSKSTAPVSNQKNSDSGKPHPQLHRASGVPPRKV